ncbi:helicase DnaB, partial [Lactiplantibacillus pentosus]|nr:helicase DnaB [Lactiplantibacillus pentosus]
AYLKQRQRPKTSAPRRKSNARPTRKEVMPKWAQKQQAGEAQPDKPNKQLSEEQRQQLAARLAKLETNSEKED